MEAIDGVDLMYANVAETLASDWMQHQIVAQEITVRSARLLNVLEPLASELGITLSSAKITGGQPGQEVYDRALGESTFERHRIANLLPLLLRAKLASCLERARTHHHRCVEDAGMT